MNSKDIEPLEKKLPFDLAIKILDIADKEDLSYALILGSCYERAEMEQKLKENPNRAISLGVNYIPDEEDFVDISLHNGKLIIEVSEGHYYDYKYIDSIDDIKETMLEIIRKSYISKFC